MEKKCSSFFLSFFERSPTQTIESEIIYRFLIINISCRLLFYASSQFDAAGDALVLMGWEGLEIMAR
jgi:hypothetical protein